MKRTTHFGFEQVDFDQKANRVAGVFNAVADRYDVMNDLMSLGIHRWWKWHVVTISGVKSGDTVLDLAGGTGDIAKQLSRKVGDSGQVVLSDINAAMLSLGRDRLCDAGCIGNMQYVQANAECLPFPENHFNCVTIAFGLRNVTNKTAALRSIFRVLKPGGRLLVLEFSKPVNPLLDRLYHQYSFHLIPKIGKLVTGDASNYRYLVESIRMHPDQKTLEQMMTEAGFEHTDYLNLTGGIVAIHRGVKL